MTRMLRFVLLLATIAIPGTAGGQEPSPPAAPADAAPQVVIPDVPPPAPCSGWRPAPTFRLGQSLIVRNDETVDDAVAVFGDAQVDGAVCGDLSVTFGNVRLGPEASVHGSLVVVGGTLSVEPGAAVLGEMVLVGGLLQAPADFRAGRGHVVVGIPLFGDQLRGAVPYLTRGLLLGRLIVPDMAWVWWAVAVLLFVYLLINLLFPQATWAATSAIVDRPLSTFAAGVLVLLLAGPIAALLAVTVIGIAVLPVLFGAMVVAWIIGKIAVCRWMGTRVFAQDDPVDRLQSTRSFLIGFAVMTVAYMIPLLGILVWGLTGVLGLGAATLALMRAFRSENPPAPPRVPRDLPPVPSGTIPATGTPAPPSDFDLNRAAGADLYGTPPAFVSATSPGSGSATGGGVPVGGAAAAPTDDRVLLAFPRAGFAERAAAFVLDAILVTLAARAVFGDGGDEMLIVLIVAYHVAFWLWKRTTLGGIICQLRVTRVDGESLRFVDALVRGVTAIFSLAAFGIGALWILRDPERQSWHDKVAGTYVVRVPRGYPV